MIKADLPPVDEGYVFPPGPYCPYGPDDQPQVEDPSDGLADDWDDPPDWDDGYEDDDWDEEDEN